MKSFKKFNKVIFYLTASDIFTWGMLTVINSFIGLYLALKLGIDVVQVVGIGAGIYSLTNGIVQMPVGFFIDKKKKDKDDVLILFFGSLLMGLPFLFYPLVQNTYSYYIIQAVIGIGSGMNLVSWRKLFAKNLDKNREGLQYGTYETIMAFSIAFFSFIIGFIANISQQYFDVVMIGIGILIMSSSIWLVKLYKIAEIND